jgi:hypothetical protein
MESIGTWEICLALLRENGVLSNKPEQVRMKGWLSRSHTDG